MKRAAIAVCLLVACGDPKPFLCDGESCGGQVSWRKTFQRTHNGKVDILFVIDDTPAMAPFTGALATGLAAMAARIREPGPVTSVHVGFARAGSCDALARGAACGVAAPESFLRSEWCHTITSFSGTFADTFACLGDLGAANCAPPQPLANTLRVVESPTAAGWEGFLRPDAYLLVVVVAAGDDASGTPGLPTPVSDLAARLKAVKLDPSQVLISIIGPQGCGSTAEPPDPRLVEFMTLFGANSAYVSLCSGQLDVALDIFRYTGDQLQPPCLSNVRDVDLDAPGLQAECVVEDRSRGPDGSLTTAMLPSCNDSSPPCWRMTAGGTCQGYVFEIDYGADWCIEAGTNATIECLGCAGVNDPACVPAR
jgi:hypothetical protein